MLGIITKENVKVAMVGIFTQIIFCFVFFLMITAPGPWPVFLVTMFLHVTVLLKENFVSFFRC